MATILLVDDYLNFRLIVAEVLRRRGYKVMEAGNGLEAKEAIEKELPDLIITDLKMPSLDGETDGKTLAEYVRGEFNGRVKIILWTGSMDFLSDEEADDFIRVSDAFLSKDISLRELQEKIKKLLVKSKFVERMTAETN